MHALKLCYFYLLVKMAHFNRIKSDLLDNTSESTSKIEALRKCLAAVKNIIL